MTTTADAPPGCSLCPPHACDSADCTHALPRPPVPRQDRAGLICGGRRFIELAAEYERELGAAHEPEEVEQ